MRRTLKIPDVQVLVFDTDLSDSMLLVAALEQQQIAYLLHCVPVRGDEVLETVDDLRGILERHRPKLLITSWRHTGPAVREAERTMTGPRPIEKWVVSRYSTQELAEQEGGPIDWVDEIYEKPLEKPLSAYFLAEKIKQRLLSLSSPRSRTIMQA